MKVSDGLSLYEHAVAQVVVTDAQLGHLDVDSLRLQRFGDAAPALEQVDDDSTHLRLTRHFRTSVG
jgi:hypothetical protein